MVKNIYSIGCIVIVTTAVNFMSYSAIAQDKFNINRKLAQLSQQAPQLNKKILIIALTAYKKALANGAVKNPVLTIIDYSLPSRQPRMWIFNITKQVLLYNTYVAHGKNSGGDVAYHFSNKIASKETSLGTFVTGNTYFGAHGYSLNLRGLERGFNDHAYERRVVVHGAPYVEPAFIKKVGRAGRSWGCLSIATTLVRPIINFIKDGSIIFAYYPDRYYLSHSRFTTS